MKKIFVVLVLTLTFIQSNAMFKRIEQITPGFDPNSVTLHMNDVEKALLQEVVAAESTQIPSSKLQRFLQDPDINCIAEFKELREHIVTSPHRQHSPQRINEFIETYKYNMRAIKHACGIDLLYEITQALVTHEC
jgi:hypothetical protein